MAEGSVLSAPRRCFSSLIKAALEGWLAMAGRSAANAPKPTWMLDERFSRPGFSCAASVSRH